MDDPQNTIFPAPNPDQAPDNLPDTSAEGVRESEPAALHEDIPYAPSPMTALESAAPHLDSFRARARAPVSPVPSRRALTWSLPWPEARLGPTPRYRHV